jgi:intein/homing endonuclease
VAEGIDLVRRMLLKVTFDGDKCLTGIRAMKEYHKEFNEKTQMYDEKPCHDWSSHGCLVAGTKVSTTEGDKNIEDIREGEFILLGDTPAKVLKAGKVKDSKTLVITLSTGEQIECTPDHGIFTHRGVVPADELCYNDIVTTKEDKAWIHLLKNTTKLRDEVLFVTKVLNTGFGKREGSLFHRLVESRLCYIKCCIGLGIAPKKLIPWMEILEILIQVTGQIEKEEQVESQAQTENIESGLEKDFIKRTMATGGVRSTVRHTGIFGNKLTEIYQRAITFIIKMVIKTITALRTWSLSVPASTLVCTLLQISGLIVKKTNSKSAELGRKQRNGMPVQKEENGTQSTESRHGLIKLLLEKLALYVEKNMKHIFLAGLNSVEAPAKHVIDVKCSEKVKPVYDLTVENHHCYYANNILVSNCDSFRYLCQGIVAFIDSQAAKASKLQPEADHDYNPLREKAIKMELREMQKLKKRKEGEQQRGLPLFAKCDYNIYDY